MKRIIASLMAVMIGATAATSVVACGKISSHPIDIDFGGNLKKYTPPAGEGDYSKDDWLKAYNGTKQSAYRSAPLTRSLISIANILSLDTNIHTNPKKLKAFRTNLMGTDELTEADKKKGLSNPSVDGLYLGKKFEHDLDPNEFYSRYEKTHINSLGGLYRLYDMEKSGNLDSTKIGQAAQESLKLATDVFSNLDGKNPDGEAFIDSFLSLHNQSYNSSWTSMTIDADSAPTELNSKILSFDLDTKEVDGKKRTVYQLSPKDPKNDLGKYLDYNKINTKIDDEKGHENEKIGNRYKKPYDLLMLPTDTQIGESNFNLNWSYPEDEKDNDGKVINKGGDKVDGSKVWDIRKPSDAGFNWNFNATEKPIPDKDQDGFIKTNESIIVPVKPLKIQFTYSTNVKVAPSNADWYTVDITIDGLQAVFMPSGGLASVKKDEEEKIGNRFIKWQFHHYQFTDQADIATIPGQKQRDKAGFGEFSNFNISSLNIQKISPPEED